MELNLAQKSMIAVRFTTHHVNLWIFIAANSSWNLHRKQMIDTHLECVRLLCTLFNSPTVFENWICFWLDVASCESASFCSIWNFDTCILIRGEQATNLNFSLLMRVCLCICMCMSMCWCVISTFSRQLVDESNEMTSEPKWMWGIKCLCIFIHNAINETARNSRNKNKIMNSRCAQCEPIQKRKYQKKKQRSKKTEQMIN